MICKIVTFDENIELVTNVRLSPLEQRETLKRKIVRPRKSEIDKKHFAKPSSSAIYQDIVDTERVINRLDYIIKLLS